jgi:hypothetical protein
VVGTDWGTDIDVTATTSHCNYESIYWMPRNPVVEDQGAMPISYVKPGSTRHLVRVTPDNGVTDLRETGTGQWASEPFDGKFAGVSNVVPGTAPGTEMFGATQLQTGDVVLNTLGANGQWQGFRSLKGAMRVAPVLVRRPTGLLRVYAMGDHASDRGPYEGQLYYRDELTTGDFTAWKRFSSGLVVETPSVISRGDETTIVARTSGNMNTVFRADGGGVPYEVARTPYVVGPRPKLVRYAQDRTMIVDVGWRPSESGGGLGAFLLAERTDRRGFEETWTFLPDLPGAPDSESRQLDAVVMPNGALAVSLHGNGGKVYVTTAKAAGSTEFHPWQQVSGEGEFTEPTSMRVVAGSLSVAAVTSGGAHHLFEAVVPQDPAAPLSFTGRQVA